MSLNPAEKKFFDWLQQQNLQHAENLSVEELRNSLRRLDPFVDAPASITHKDIKMTCADGHAIRLRYYYHDENANRPLIIFLPGNGFVYDLFEVNHSVISKIAKNSGCNAIMVEYRLAPEFPYPNALNDVFETVKFIFKNADQFHADKNKIILAGHSSGANLAAVVTNRLRQDTNQPIFHQLLISGAYDYTNSLHDFDEYAMQDKLLSPSEIKFSFDSYCHAAQRSESTCSPYWEKDLSGLPPTTIMVAEYDGGRSHSEAYAKKLTEAGNNITKIVLPGQTHGTILYRKALSDGKDPALVAAEQISKILK